MPDGMHLSRFSRLCWAHGRDQHTERHRDHARLYVSQPLVSYKCPPTCSKGSLALAGCALYGNNIRPNGRFVSLTYRGDKKA